jgi:hypothetical protein
LISNLVDARGETSQAPGVAGGVTSPYWTRWIDSSLRTPGNRDSDGMVVVSAPPPIDASGARYAGFADLASWDQVRDGSSSSLANLPLGPRPVLCLTVPSEVSVHRRGLGPRLAYRLSHGRFCC